MRLYRAIATVGGMTMISRVLGFVRDMLIAGVLGTGIIADAFFVAFRFPNLFRRLFAEGAFNAAFVPLFAKRLEGDGHGKARAFAEQSLGALLIVLVIVSAVAEIGMPWFMYLLAPGFADTPEKFDLAVLLTRIAFPYLLCMSLVALLSGVLNSFQRFAAAAAAPILLNITLITAMALAAYLGFGNTREAGIILAWGVAIAGFCQLTMLYVATMRAGLTLKPRLPQRGGGIRDLVRLGIPGVISGGITQLNIVIGTIIASMQDSAVSYLYYADRIYQLPLGVVGVAIGVVLLPEISRRLRAGDMLAVADSQNRALEFGLLLSVPAAAALVVAAEPIARVLFERGAFTSTDTKATALALAAFAGGLPAFVLIKVFQPAFFAREDTKTPMFFAVVNMAVNIGGAVALYFLFRALGYLPHVGIAIATSLAAWINVVLLWRSLSRRGYFAFDSRTRRSLPMIVLSSLAMAVALAFAQYGLAPYFQRGQGALAQVSALSLLIALGLGIFVLTAQLTGALKLSELRRSMRRS